MEHQKRLFDMLSGEMRPRGNTDNQENSPHGGRTSSRNDPYNTGANDRIDRSPLNDQTIDINRKLVSLDSEYTHTAYHLTPPPHIHPPPPPILPSVCVTTQPTPPHYLRCSMCKLQTNRMHLASPLNICQLMLLVTGCY